MMIGGRTRTRNLDPLIKSPIVLQLFQLRSRKPVGFCPIDPVKELQALQNRKEGVAAAALALPSGSLALLPNARRRPALQSVRTNAHDEVIARAANLIVGRAAYETARRLYPQDTIHYRCGVRVIERSDGRSYSISRSI